MTGASVTISLHLLLYHHTGLPVVRQCQCHMSYHVMSYIMSSTKYLGLTDPLDSPPWRQQESHDQDCRSQTMVLITWVTSSQDISLTSLSSSVTCNDQIVVGCVLVQPDRQLPVRGRQVLHALRDGPRHGKSRGRNIFTELIQVYDTVYEKKCSEGSDEKCKIIHVSSYKVLYQILLFRCMEIIEWWIMLWYSKMFLFDENLSSLFHFQHQSQTDLFPLLKCYFLRKK